MNFRQYKAYSFLFLLALGVWGCDSGHNGGGELPKEEIQKITVAQWGQEKYLIYLPFYLAQEKGFFTDQGLEITVKYSGNDDQVFATVMSGEAQFGIGDPTFTAISREKGGTGKVVASIVDGVSRWGITKKNISTIAHPSDLAGLRIGTFPEPSTVFTLMKNTISEHPDELADMSIVQAPIGAQLALLENNSVDIAIELEPNVSIAEHNGYKVVYSAPRFFGSFAFTGVTTTESYIKDQPRNVQKFVNSIQMALDYSREHTDSTVLIAQSLFPSIDPEIVGHAVSRMLKDKTIPQNSTISNEGWQHAMEIRVQVGDLKEIKPTKDAVDNSFASNAIKNNN